MKPFRKKTCLLRFLLPLFLILMTSGCGIFGEKKLYGKATPIPEGLSPVDVIRTIQNEFIQLEKPILKKIKHHKQWKKYNFADSTYTYGPFDEVVLTRETYDFFKKHTVREILTALTPLLFDPQIGGEVAVLLSGLPRQTLEQASKTHCGRTLLELGYTSPEEKGVWDIRSRICSAYIGFPGVYHDAYETPEKGTLDHAIYSVLKTEYSVRNHPKRDYFEPFAAKLEGKMFKTLEEFKRTPMKPKPSEKFQQFLASHSDLFSTTVLLASVRNNRIALIGALDMYDEFWPLSVYWTVFDATPFQKTKFKSQISEMEAAFVQQAGRIVYQGYKT